jgi:MarR family transcriptional regulator, organic hydroperoxide resistance regulator
MDYRELAIELTEAFSRPHFAKREPEHVHGEMGIMMFLQMNKIKNGVESFSSGDLSKALELSTGRMAIALNGLEKKGFIRRTTDYSDRRRVIVSITEDGSAFAESQHEKGLDRFEKMLRALGEEDAVEFVRITKRIAEQFLNCNK